MNTKPTRTVLSSALLALALGGGTSFPLAAQQTHELANPAQAFSASQPVNRTGDGFVEIPRCFTRLIADVAIPAQEAGPLVSILVSEGQAVEAGQQLAAIDDRLAQLRMETAQVKRDAASQKANSDVDIRAAQNALEIANSEQEADYGLYRKQALPKRDYDRTVLKAKQAALQLEQARNDKETAIKEMQVEEFNVRAAAESIQRHSIASPVTGIVMELNKDAGEWVNAGDNVMRVARMDQLYVEGWLDPGLFNPHDVHGRPVTVVATLAQGEQVEFSGRVVFVALEKFSTGVSVRAQVDNRMAAGHWLLLAHEEVTMRIQTDGEAVAHAADGSARSYR